MSILFQMKTKKRGFNPGVQSVLYISCLLITSLIFFVLMVSFASEKAKLCKLLSDQNANFKQMENRLAISEEKVKGLTQQRDSVLASVEPSRRPTRPTTDQFASLGQSPNAGLAIPAQYFVTTERKISSNENSCPHDDNCQDAND